MDGFLGSTEGKGRRMLESVAEVLLRRRCYDMVPGTAFTPGHLQALTMKQGHLQLLPIPQFASFVQYLLYRTYEYVLVAQIERYLTLPCNQYTWSSPPDRSQAPRTTARASSTHLSNLSSAERSRSTPSLRIVKQVLARPSNAVNATQLQSDNLLRLVTRLAASIAVVSFPSSPHSRP